MMSIDFLMTTLIVVVSPGIGVLYTLATGLSRGARASVVAAFGCTLGIVPHMAAAIMGLAALLHTSAIAFQTLKYLGVAYLLYMAWMTLKEHGALKVEKKVDQKSATAGDRARHPDQHPEPQALDLLLRLPAAVRQRRGGRSRCCACRSCRRVHADDLRGVRGLRPVRRRRAQARDLAAARADLDAPRLRRRFCRCWAPSWPSPIDDGQSSRDAQMRTLRWFIVFLLFAITIVNYIDRAAISYAIPLIQRDLGLSPAETGAILGAFGLGYAITTLLGGFAVDRYGARIVLTVAAILWSLSIGMTALASSVRHALRGARAAGRVGRAQLPGADRRGQPLAVAARAGDGAGQCLAGRAAGARDRRADRHPAARLARLAADLRRPVRPVGRLGAAVVLPVPRQPGRVALRQPGRARPYPHQRPAGLRRPACRPEVLARART